MLQYHDNDMDSRRLELEARRMMKPLRDSECRQYLPTLVKTSLGIIQYSFTRSTGYYWYRRHNIHWFFNRVSCIRTKRYDVRMGSLLRFSLSGLAYIFHVLNSIVPNISKNCTLAVFYSLDRVPTMKLKHIDTKKIVAACNCIYSYIRKFN